MQNDPNGKEQLSKQRSPRLVSTVNGIGYTSNNTNKVDHKHSGWGNEETCPLEDIELSKVTILIRGLGGDSEVGVNTGKDLEETLEDSEEMSRSATNDPELFIPPPILNADTTPTQFKETRGENRDKKENEPHASIVTDLKNYVSGIKFRAWSIYSNCGALDLQIILISACFKIDWFSPLVSWFLSQLFTHSRFNLKCTYFLSAEAICQDL
jgi:hypothetical protein